MTNQKYGAVDWSDKSFGNEGKSSGGKDLWMRLKPGSNLIRVLTVPHLYHQHKYKFPDEKGYGHRIPCSAKHGSCVVCAKGDKAKKRWYLGVIDRLTNSYKILDVSWSVLSDVQTYADDQDWGDPSQYDFDIVVNPNGGPQNYYKAVAKPKRPLSAQDLLLKEKVDLDYLEAKCTPPEPSKVEERFNSLEEEFGGHGSNSKVDAPVSFGSDDDSEFPDNDAQAIEAPF